jgi:tripartite-type tricarboxylate transporter receptor subunit TctC
VLYKKLPYDAMKGFTHISGVLYMPAMMAVNAEVPAKSVREFIALAKAKPNGYLFGSSGNGSAPQLWGEQFKLVTGAPVVHVPYKGSGPAVVDLAAGQVHLMFDGLPSLIGQIKSGRLRALAVLHDKRFVAFPDIPTIAEAGSPGMEGGIWYGLSGPSGIPRPIVDRLAKEAARVVSQPDVQERFATVGGLPMANGPKQYEDFIRSEHKKWGDIVRLSGAVAD